MFFLGIFNRSPNQRPLFLTYDFLQYRTSSSAFKKEVKNMADNVVGTIPEFTSDETEVKQEEVKPEETETPAEPSTVEKPAEIVSEDTGEPSLEEIQRQREGLLIEKNSLLSDIQELRKARRGLREEAQPVATPKDVDELKDLHPDDVTTIDRILKAKGYLSKTELDKKLYETEKQVQVNQFLEKYPEYKPENDANDIKWQGLQGALRQWYRLPENPKDIGKVLEKAHKDISISSGLNTSVLETKQKQMKTASLGGSGLGKGTKVPSSLESFNADKVYALRSGGYSDEEIKTILNKLE